MIRVSCGCGSCDSIVIELAESRLASARTDRERATMIHNYVINRAKMALFGKLRIVVSA